MTDYPFKSDPPKLSLCMIVKNEEAWLEACLESVAGLVDEIIVVDTGSEDDTVDIARRYNARTFNFAWSDDFSAARNESIRHASGDWILYLDADEQLVPESKKELQMLLRDEDAKCVNVLITSPGRPGKNGHTSRAHRLFLNLPGVRFQGRIHEQVFPFFAQLGYASSESQIRILHQGYAKDESTLAKKNRRNLRLLKRQIEDTPEEPYWHFCIAQTLMLSRRYREASEFLRNAITLGGLPDDILCTAHNNLAEIYIRWGAHDEARAHLGLTRRLNPEQVTSELLEYQIHEQRGDIRGQIRCLSSAVARLEQERIDYSRAALEVCIDPCPLYFRLSTLYLSVNDRQAAQTVLQKLLQLEPHNVLALERSAFIALKNRDFAQAAKLYKKLLPQDATGEIKKRLAGIYYKMDDFRNAERYLQKNREI